MARDRIRYDRNVAYQRLVDDEGVFNTYVDFFMFCAALGYTREEKVPNAYKGADHELLWSHVEGTELFETVSKSIAYQETGDPDVLDDQERQLEFLAEYAAAGAEIAAEEFETVSDDLVDIVARFVLEEGPSPGAGTVASQFADTL
jgi:dnd system-associated protein 4